MKVKTITLDTCCINTKQGIEAINRLEKWNKQKLVEIVKTDVMDTEFINARASFKTKALKKSQNYQEDIGVGVWNHSRWNHSRFDGDSIDYPLDDIRNLLFPHFDKLSDDEKRRAIRDSMHLATHKMHNRDFFVTEDKDFLDKKDSIKEHFVITVLSPTQLVERLKLR